MYDIHTLRVFMAVVEARGIRGAAERLARTPSAISLTLKQLEGQLGAPLFEGGRKILLTELGKVVFEEGRDLLAHYDRFRASILAQARNENTHIEVACPPSVSVSLLPYIVHELGQQPAPVRVRVRDMDSRSVIEAVAAGQIDIGIGHKLYDEPAVTFQPLFIDQLALVCRANSAYAKRRRAVAWKDLQGEPYISHPGHGEISDPAFFEMVQQAQVHSVTVISLFALVKAGIGVTILSKLLTQADTSLRFVDLADPAARQVVSLIARAGYRHSPATLTFLAMLQQVIAREHLRLGLKLIAP